MTTSKSIVLTLAMTVAVPGWAQTGNSGASGNPNPSATSTGGSMVTPDDAQIAGILKAVDDSEIEAAKYAQVHASNREVKNYARQMSVDHREAETKANKALKSAGVTPQTNETTSLLQAEAKQALDHLKTLKGKDFDKAYVESQIQMHRKALDTIDKQLLPNAKSADLKSHIQDVRPKIEAHLRQAETLETKLTK